MSLWHHGIKGMHWGIRRTPEELGHEPKLRTLGVESDNSKDKINLIVDSSGKTIKMKGEYWTSDKGFAIHPNKIKRFCLLPGSKHSEHFFRVGYTQEDNYRLFHDIEEAFDPEKAIDHRTDSKGIGSYSIPMYLGVNDKRLFRIVWKDEKSIGLPKFVTAHIDDELEKELGLK